MRLKRYSIFLLFSFLFTNATIVGVIDLIPFILHKISIHQILESSEEKLEHITFHKTTFAKYQIDRKEFRWQGIMYDIVSSRLISDSIHIVAYKDIKESLILKGIEDHNQNEESKMLLKKILSLVFDLPVEIELPKIVVIKIVLQKIYFSTLYQHLFSPYLLRPPSSIY